MSSRAPNKTSRVCCATHPDATLIEDYRAGDLVCPECGLVVGDRVIDVGTEWRTFSNETSGDDPSRVGSAENPLLSGHDLSTSIGAATGPAGLDAQGFSKYKNRKTMSSADRALTSAFKEISAMAERINLPRSIVDQANLLFKQVYETKALRGRSSDAIASACLYIACRKEGVPRSFKEICAISRISKKEIGRCFKLILRQLETSVDLITTGDFMARFCANLSLAQLIQRAATQIARKATDLDVVPGRSPISVAAAAIFMACSGFCEEKERKNAKEIVEITGVAESTIRQTYKLLLPHVEKLIPDEIRGSMKIPIEMLPRT